MMRGYRYGTEGYPAEIIALLTTLSTLDYNSSAYLGVDENDVRIRPAILPESLECNGGPTQISTQEGGIIYTPTSDGKYRIQFKAILDVKYEDTLHP